MCWPSSSAASPAWSGAAPAGPATRLWFSSDYAKKCGVGGLFHTDELPAYGVTGDEVAALRSTVGADVDDAVVLVAATRQKAARARSGRWSGAPASPSRACPRRHGRCSKAVRAHMRPLPGAARMCPETDVLPEAITPERWAAVQAPGASTEREKRYRGIRPLPRHGPPAVYSERLLLFDDAVSRGIAPGLAARTVLATLKELSRDGVDVGRIGNGNVLAILGAVGEGRAAKEAVPDLLRAVADGAAVDEALAQCAPAVTGDELAAIVDRVVAERGEFVRERGIDALGPLMGVVMAEVRGSADGKRVAGLLREAIGRLLG